MATGVSREALVDNECFFNNPDDAQSWNIIAMSFPTECYVAVQAHAFEVCSVCASASRREVDGEVRRFRGSAAVS